MSCSVILCMFFEDDDEPTTLKLIRMAALPRVGDRMGIYGRELGSLEANDYKYVNVVVEEVWWDGVNLDVDEDIVIPKVLIGLAPEDRLLRKKMCVCERPIPGRKMIESFEGGDESKPVYSIDKDRCDDCGCILQDSDNSAMLARNS